MGNGLNQITLPYTHSVSSTEVHPTVSKDIAFPASDNEVHAVEHTEHGRSEADSVRHTAASGMKY